MLQISTGSLFPIALVNRILPRGDVREVVIGSFDSTRGAIDCVYVRRPQSM